MALRQHLDAEPLGEPQVVLDERVLGAVPAETGVVDADCRAFGYRNLLVCDGAAIPANPGVNPSLTITALAERTMSRVPPRTAGNRITELPTAARSAPSRRRTTAG